MVNLNTSQISAVASVIYTKLRESIKEKEQQLETTILNDPEFVAAYDEFKTTRKEGEKLRKKAENIIDDAYKKFQKKYPIVPYSNVDTIKDAAKRHVQLIMDKKLNSIKRNDIKDKVALYSIETSLLEDLIKKIINLYDTNL